MSAAQLLMSWPLDCTAQVSPECESFSTTRLPLLRSCICDVPVMPASDMVVPSLVSAGQRRQACPSDQAAKMQPAATSGCAATPVVLRASVVVDEPSSATETRPSEPATRTCEPVDAACCSAGEFAAIVPARLTLEPSKYSRLVVASSTTQ